MTATTLVPVDPTIDPALTQEFKVEPLPQDDPDAQLAARIADLEAERATLLMLFREVRYDYTSKVRLRQIALGVLARYDYFLGTALEAAEELRQETAAPETPAP